MNKVIQKSSKDFYVKGMHCAACEVLLEDKLAKHPDVSKVKANLASQKVTVELKQTPTDDLQDELNILVTDSGYSLSTREHTSHIDLPTLGQALLLALLFMGFFILLQKLGIVNLVSATKITLPFVFLIGVVASLSTCMAIVGGLVLSLSSTYAKSDIKHTFPHLVQFHVSRLVGFLVLGGIIGFLGKAFTLTPQTSFIINLVLFVFMVILGINLLDIFPQFSKFQFRIPKFIGTKILSIKNQTHPLTPIILGAITFFLPCGFTQSMQLYSLTTGSFANGAVTMFVFALGTLPVLAVISIASVKLSKSFQSELFFKTSGFIVLLFALLNFIGALAALGYINPILSI